MNEKHTNAEAMAKAAGLPKGKTYRSRLRRKHPNLHDHGNWTVLLGIYKHQVMERELFDMLGRRSDP